MLLWVLGFNGFKQLHETDDNDLRIPIFIEFLDASSKIDFGLEKNCCSCSWENLMFINEQKLYVKGFFGCKDHCAHYVNLSDGKLFSKSNLSILLNGGIDFGVLTNLGKFIVCKVLCSSNSVDQSLCEISILYELKKKCCFADYSWISSKYVVVCDDGKILSIKRTNGISQFTITSEIEFNRKVKQISCGNDHSMVLTSSGCIYSWGIGSRGQLGQGDLLSRDRPTQVEDLDGVAIRQIACGGWHSVALAETDDLYTWGWNESGQTGFPAPKSFPSDAAQRKPIRIASNHNVEAYRTAEQSARRPEGKGLTTESLFYEHSCSTENNIDSGENTLDDLEPLSVRSNPSLLELERYLAVEANSFIAIADVACGSRHTVAVTSCGQVLSWGWEKYGQLGHGCCVADNSNKPYCESKPHIPNLVKFGGKDNIVIRGVKCGFWNTMLFGDKIS